MLKMTLHQDELLNIEKETVEDKVKTRVLFNCAGPYPENTWDLVFAKIEVYTSGKKEFNCDGLIKGDPICYKSSEDKKCPFLM